MIFDFTNTRYFQTKHKKTQHTTLQNQPNRENRHNNPKNTPQENKQKNKNKQAETYEFYHRKWAALDWDSRSGRATRTMAAYLHVKNRAQNQNSE